MIELITEPTNKHLDQIESWLIDEQHNHNEGFYCNWNLIIHAFDEKRLYCLVENNRAIGFVYWYTFEIMVRLDIVEIKREKRDLGLGRLMIEKSLEQFRAEGFVVTEIECSPAESEPFWRALGYANYFMSNYSGNQRMFKPLIPFAKLRGDSKEAHSALTIELWSGEPHETRNDNSNWSWEVNHEKNSTKLIAPIIYPANQNWRIRCMQGEDIVYDGKIKHRNDGEIIHKANFLFVQDYLNS